MNMIKVTLSQSNSCRALYNNY